MDYPVCNDDKLHRVAELLIENREKLNDWGEIAKIQSDKCTKEIANKFLLCCLIDLQSNANDAWNRGYGYFERLDAEHKCELWKMIADMPHERWKSEENFRECRLHRMHWVHNRLWPIANCICMFFEGDARKIWQNSTLFDVLCRLYYIGAGEQISRMIVGALKDCGHISADRSDVKADVHVCRVLGRVFVGDKTTPWIAINIARDLKPEDPWQLDSAIWILGKTRCNSESPKCVGCYLESNCKYAQEHSSRG